MGGGYTGVGLGRLDGVFTFVREGFVASFTNIFNYLCSAWSKTAFGRRWN